MIPPIGGAPMGSSPGGGTSVAQRDGGDRTNDPPADTKIVFLTSTTYAGNLMAVGGEATGLESADALCVTAGMASGRGAQWKAWLSDSSTDAIDRIADVGPWYTTNGSKAFNNKANLATTPLTPIQWDENGAAVFDAGLVWTGTQNGGVGDSNNCTDWTSTGEWGAAGRYDDASSWTDHGTTAIGCDGGGFKMHLYCLEQ